MKRPLVRALSTVITAGCFGTISGTFPVSPIKIAAYNTPFPSAGAAGSGVRAALDVIDLAEIENMLTGTCALGAGRAARGLAGGWAGHWDLRCFQVLIVIFRSNKIDFGMAVHVGQ